MEEQKNKTSKKQTRALQKQNIVIKHPNRHFTHFNEPIPKFESLAAAEHELLENIETKFAQDQILMNLTILNAKTLGKISNLRIKLSLREISSNKLTLIGRSEIIRNNINASFRKQFILSIEPFRNQSVLFEIFDLDNDYVEREDSLIAVHEVNIENIIEAVLNKQDSIHINFSDKVENKNTQMIVFLKSSVENPNINIFNIGIDRVQHFQCSELNKELNITVSTSNPEQRGCFLLKSLNQKKQPMQHFYITSLSKDDFINKISGIMKSCEYDQQNGLIYDNNIGAELNVFVLILRRLTSYGNIDFFSRIRTMYFEQTSSVKAYSIDNADIVGLEQHVSNQKTAEELFGMPNQQKTFHFLAQGQKYQICQILQDKLQKLKQLQKLLKQKLAFQLTQAKIIIFNIVDNKLQQIEGTITATYKNKKITISILTVISNHVSHNDTITVDQHDFKSFTQQQVLFRTVSALVQVKQLKNGSNVLYFDQDDLQELDLIKNN